MPEIKDQAASAEKQFRVHFLMREAGISETQAHELVDLVGFEVAILLREAKLLKER